MLVVRWLLAPHHDYAAARAAYHPFNALVDPDPRARDAIARMIARAVMRGQPAIVIANNKAEGSSPLSVEALARAVVETLPPNAPAPDRCMDAMMANLAETGGAAPLGARLRHVYWIGGGSGAGKSTIAQRLAQKHGLELYATDAVMGDHARRSIPKDSPLLSAFSHMDMDERWINRSPETMLETFHWFRGEGFRLIVEDLLALPQKPGVIVEGLRLLPRLVQPLLEVPSRGVWLLPTPEFRRTAFESRGTLWEIPRKTSDPERAMRNLLERDRMFTDRLRQEAEQVGVLTIEIDASTSEDSLTDRVATQFGL